VHEGCGARSAEAWKSGSTAGIANTLPKLILDVEQPDSRCSESKRIASESTPVFVDEPLPRTLPGEVGCHPGNGRDAAGFPATARRRAPDFRRP
jgi:hypothetical protein